MEYRKILVSLVFVLALVALAASSVSAMGDFTRIEVNGDDALVSGANIAAFAGQNLPVRVVFTSNDVSADDVRVKVWLSGARDYSVSSERFDVLPGRTYSRLVSLQIPSNIDPEEDLTLKVSVESANEGDVVAEKQISLAAQRESYLVEILDVSSDTSVKAGENFALNIVLKNRGRQFADDTFVIARIPALGIESKAYFGDLSPVDQGEESSRGEEEDAVERRMFLRIPSNVPAGIYLVEIEAYNADSDTTITKKVAIGGASEGSMVISATTSKTFAVGERGTYSLTLVNSGNSIRVYQLGFETASGLTVDADESVAAVPAGMSKTVKIMASSDKAGTYGFAVNVMSDGQLVKKESYTAVIQGKSAAGIGSNATVLLTVVLAIIFVVLLVVLIVLLTRKPQKSEEFGESYY